MAKKTSAGAAKGVDGKLADVAESTSTTVFEVPACGTVDMIVDVGPMECPDTDVEGRHRLAQAGGDAVAARSAESEFVAVGSSTADRVYEVLGR